MRTPDPQLAEIYGTDKLAVSGHELVLAAHIASAILGLGIMKADSSHVEAQRQEAQQLNEIARFNEARKMEAMIGAMKMAEAAGATMASMNKEAFGGSLFSKLVPAVKGALTPGWKAKTLATAGTLGVGYAGYKGMSALRDHANTPRSTQQYGRSNAVAHNINEYGYREQ